jgi:nitronate monooxygenase
VTSPRARAAAFCARHGLAVPVVQAPMAGVSPVGLAAGVAQAGGMGALGALMLPPDAIGAWAQAFRAQSNGAFQVNLWVPDPDPPRDPAREDAARAAIAALGPMPPPLGPGPFVQDFAAQAEALLAAAPPVASSIMGLFPPPLVAALKARGIAWFATVATVRDAMAAEAAGADALIVQGAEAGGHRGAFDAEAWAGTANGLFALLPRIAARSTLPLIAAGGIMDGRGVAAALCLGASAVQCGTAFLRSPEAAIAPAWAAALAATEPEDTVLTRVFSGRAARAVANAATAAALPLLPYPLQRAATGPMKDAAAAAGDASRMQMWAGQGAALARAEPAGDILRAMWAEAEALLA